MDKSVRLIVLAIVNSVILYLLSMLFKHGIVLGNDKVVSVLAALYAGIILAIAIFVVPYAVSKSGYKKIKNENIRLPIYLVVDFAAVWIIKRFAFVTGLGITNDLYVLLTAVLLAGAGFTILRRH